MFERQKKCIKLFVFLLLTAFVCVLLTRWDFDRGVYHRMQKETIESAQYRSDFFSESMRKDAKRLSPQCKKLLERVENEAKYFPIPISTADKSLTVSYVDSWMGERTYKGNRGHEGTDIMASQNVRGLYPVLSMTDGTVTKLGWLEKGGYRIGITTSSGTYYYYAHLESYGNLGIGDTVKAGDFLGYMGDSGYGPEGTVGQFAVHLHLGIYSYETGEEISVNPYYVLKWLENKKLRYAYS